MDNLHTFIEEQRAKAITYPPILIQADEIRAAKPAFSRGDMTYTFTSVSSPAPVDGISTIQITLSPGEPKQLLEMDATTGYASDESAKTNFFHHSTEAEGMMMISRPDNVQFSLGHSPHWHAIYAKKIKIETIKVISTTGELKDQPVVAITLWDNLSEDKLSALRGLTGTLTITRNRVGDFLVYTNNPREIRYLDNQLQLDYALAGRKRVGHRTLLNRPGDYQGHIDPKTRTRTDRAADTILYAGAIQWDEQGIIYSYNNDCGRYRPMEEDRTYFESIVPEFAQPNAHKKELYKDVSKNRYSYYSVKCEKCGIYIPNPKPDNKMSGDVKVVNARGGPNESLFNRPTQRADGGPAVEFNICRMCALKEDYSVKITTKKNPDGSKFVHPIEWNQATKDKNYIDSEIYFNTACDNCELCDASMQEYCDNMLPWHERDWAVASFV